MPDWSKGRGQKKKSPWSSKLRADNPLGEKNTCSGKKIPARGKKSVILQKPKIQLQLRPIGSRGTRFSHPVGATYEAENDA